MEPTIWRVQLIPSPKEGITYEDVLNFCMEHEIIGVGWNQIICKEDSYQALKDAVNASSYESKKSALRAINAMRKMKPGDLIWTRLGRDGSEYYLCQVTSKLWKDRVITQEHVDYGICQFVSVKWSKIGKENHVPGKVINSFIPSAAVQGVHDVTAVSQFIWNQHSKNTEDHYEIIKSSNFWDVIGSEDLECLILLYLQHEGYYLYSSTLKKGTAKYEVAMVSHDGKVNCYPQVKRVTPLFPEQYTNSLANNEKVILFSTSECYGENRYSNVECLLRKDIEEFMRSCPNILPNNVKYWMHIADFN